ncbi:winged helix-turn-helix domain-containing protein [Methanosarcina sp. KYL-1]|uniref:helix-turn-helix transcriptional regulator n=1 Tax=Methanosarcina sp. KYL-1 TaxID=2602068 RepID=UPI002101666F|nr:winged helix-turn-helix domain-containing protein [Methanosarcina sp. KYL-1]MCQ1535859.1 winged helix-turn-helix domain-containing protein [Methanosarcina sp. KYL-1]
MEASYLDLIFFSKKRKDILLLLRDGPKSLEEIKTVLDATAISIQPQIKLLKGRHLLRRENNAYELTLIGEAIVDKMQGLVDTLEALESKYDFWESHRLDGIPPDLLKRIGDLKCSTFARPLDGGSMFSPHTEFVENIAKSDYVKGISPFIHPLYPKMFLAFAERGTDVSLIVTASVFERMRTEFRSELEPFLGLNNTKLYVYEKEMLLSSAVTNCFLSLGLFYNNGTYDHANDILCFEPEALQWGEDLFTYYQGMSREVTEI